MFMKMKNLTLLKMKNLLLLLLFILNYSVYSQNNATDFTTEDCNGVIHNLFDSLDAGNVIVISWVMPCGPCATYTLPAYNAVQTFSSTHPGLVDFYLADDYANSSCTSIANWAINYNMPNHTAFSSSAINMLDYGSLGMPKVVVLGGEDHTVFYNENDDKINYAAVEMAINNALTPSVVSNIATSSINVFPNPASKTLNITFTEENFINFKSLEIKNIYGKAIESYSFKNLESYLDNLKIDISHLENGTYFLSFLSGKNKTVAKFVVLH